MMAVINNYHAPHNFLILKINIAIIDLCIAEETAAIAVFIKTIILITNNLKMNLIGIHNYHCFVRFGSFLSTKCLNNFTYRG